MVGVALLHRFTFTVGILGWFGGLEFDANLTGRSDGIANGIVTVFIVWRIAPSNVVFNRESASGAV